MLIAEELVGKETVSKSLGVDQHDQYPVLKPDRSLPLHLYARR